MQRWIQVYVLFTEVHVTTKMVLELVVNCQYKSGM